MTTALRVGLALAVVWVLGGAAAASDLDKLRWLEGTWKVETDRGTLYETWRVVSDRTFEGESYSVDPSGERRVVTEWLLLVEMGDNVFYVPRPRQNPMPVAFPLVSVTDDTVVFENPDHDFPQRITYQRNGDDSVTATVEAPGRDGGEPRRIVLEFTRGH